MIQADSLVKRYAAVTAVDGVSFDIGGGDVVGFLGPNGAGKSTIMRILTSFTPATSGTATVAGHDVFSDSIAARHAIGYLPENVPLYPEMRVKEYLDFRAKLKGVPRGKRVGQVGGAMGRCGISNVARRPIGHLSKGYRQRVGLADALVHNPPILILDEPTIGLDPNQIREIRQVIKDLGEGHTVVLSTHILPEVEMICKRFLILDQGKIVAQDSIDSLKKKTRVFVTFDRAPDGVEESLVSIPGVDRVRREKSRFVLETASRAADGERAIERKVFQIAAGKDWIITELKREAVTLEDVFVGATMKDHG
jgi:ABC-2 type transport system ATP-binding protein